MYSFIANRVQYPIGQGGFHHTRIYCRRAMRSFSIVFDCGGSNKAHRKSVIESFADSQPSEHDWLVISHLDLDHINGIPQLKENKQTFKNVILPHLKKQERAKYFGWMALAELAEGRDVVEIREGILTSIGLYDGSYGPPVMITPEALEGPQPDDGEGLEQETLDFPANVAAALASAREGSTLSHCTSFTLANLDWQFRFYSREWDSAQIEAVWGLTVLKELKELITKLFEVGSGELSNWDSNVIELLEKTISREECEKALSEIKTGRKAKNSMTLKKLLTELYKLSDLENYNCASLCMYSGPRDRGNEHVRFRFSKRVYGLPDFELARLQPINSTRSVGWLGTGDAHFPNQSAVTAFADHFSSELPLVSTVVVPHHGSKYNYANGDISPLLSLITFFCLGVRLFIAPAKRSVYGHPHEEVENALRNTDVFHTVSEAAVTQLQESIQVSWRL